MSAQIIDGKAIAAQVRAGVAEGVKAFNEQTGHVPGLATVLVGDDPASHIYINSKHKAATEAGMHPQDIRLPEDTSEGDLLARIAELNADEAVDGILVQLPLPAPIDEARVIRSIAPMKDVDGLHPFNAGELFLDRPTLAPATPSGVIELLTEYKIPLSGARAVVIGRSSLVGKPVAMMLLRQNATVTMCHSRTADLARHTLDADVLVAAVGLPAVVTADMVKLGAAVVDVGINRTEGGIVGDVEADAAERAAFMTPVPGGVGPMTIAMLLRNTVKAARYRRGVLAFPTT
jgi:methylenetetrahydrofolate dehydrogenase (NADP+)/methenyltetrahydrofolate cyclohydrolase